jgi:Flp pilus assembly pilin Flp
MRFAWSVRAQRVRSFLYRWAAEDRGSVATEYGLLLMLIALAIVVGATALGIAVSHMFDQGRSAIPKISLHRAQSRTESVRPAPRPCPVGRRPDPPLSPPRASVRP